MLFGTCESHVKHKTEDNEQAVIWPNGGARESNYGWRAASHKCSLEKEALVLPHLLSLFRTGLLHSTR
eukprot:1160829-Pelagomonas_calceolata.AAC.10